MRTLLLSALCLLSLAVHAMAQSTTLNFSTVERPPFAFYTDTGIDGFSVDLMRAIGREIGAEVEFEMKTGFTEMLSDVETGLVDGAIANISITGAREAVMDFSLPIFRSGLQIMIPVDDNAPSLWGAILNRELGIALLVALGVLMGMGMLMWVFERNKQPYFDRGAGEVAFPAFWYALNLVVNGGFEQNVPRSGLGRLFAVLMVISSLFIVSFFVANITTVMTVRALGDHIDSISDLEGREVATTTGSTSSEFLAQREIPHRTFFDFSALLWAFEDGELDAIVFDSPLLAYYVANEGRGKARLIDRVFRPEDYGIALPQGSALREQINVALLRLQESGQYDELYLKWFEAGR
ncbi:transporter substrate-binding domain-containing protein [uncultured Tateyamaria sp.]|uniref:transporter substrate-binding domain-containing protein n=1 Tax=uncultured Tateyamaria sp. TaxID=455651 RepID=UPI00261D153F|nr:transporter substrate-binding domain-containing protein [uncultured Tateyamaria sp.]